MNPSFPDLMCRKVANLLGQTTIGYPGAAPLSFSSLHLAELQQKDYYVCEKSDGIRCLMYMARGYTNSGKSGIHYLIDRKNDYRYVSGLHYPKPDDETFLSIHDDTIIDGELVLDTYEDGSQQLKYLVFDILVLGGHRVMHDTFDKRLAYLKAEVLGPYKDMCRDFPQEGRPFIIEVKSMYPSYNIEMMFHDIIPKVKRIRGNDGLIFTCCNTPYYIGLDEHILKWKPASDNTARSTALPNQITNVIPIYHLSVMLSPQEYLPFGEMYVSREEWDDLRAMRTPLDGTIVECYKDSESRWCFYRLRNDKRDANPISVVEKTLKSIADCVTEDDLTRAAPAIKTAWEARQSYDSL
ncbi:putative mRNA capping enzyme alpha subunit [Aspergillus bombycis]|uniref:mRNA guanylyltransferase n=1 Tax=Aspergillus bombycis TaxID=109264 RepID=A0A1F7ZMN6_9EURO|nr:putative mRNA capping enzyme alpha subunit [Aspergillus bombycis]OGM40694.1 putative mRNA capping enzyme alpha subunit [Aspergillus bombycis]